MVYTKKKTGGTYLEKKGHTWKNKLHLQKWVRLVNMGHTEKNHTSHLKKKWFSLGKIGHT